VSPLDETAHLSRETQLLTKHWEKLSVYCGLLYRTSKKLQPKLVVPQRHGQTLLHLVHSLPGSNHEGVTKFLWRLKRFYYWAGMDNDARRFVASCDICQRQKSNIDHPQHPLMPLECGFPGQRLHLDFAGPLAETPRGNKYILVMVDAFSGYVHAEPTKDMSAVTTVEKLINGWMAYFGCCESIMSDRGANFESQLMEILCAQLGIRKASTTAGHAAANGRVECSVKGIKQQLRVHCQQTGADWDRALPFALMTLRSGINTPSHLFLG